MKDKEHNEQIVSYCLKRLAEVGVRPVSNILRIKSGSIGIRRLGCVDFLARHGYKVFWLQ